MKAVFYNYQTENEEREDIFEFDLQYIPRIGEHIVFNYYNDIHVTNVVHIDHILTVEGVHRIEIELAPF